MVTLGYKLLSAIATEIMIKTLLVDTYLFSERYYQWKVHILCWDQVWVQHQESNYITISC